MYVVRNVSETDGVMLSHSDAKFVLEAVVRRVRRFRRMVLFFNPRLK